MLVADNNISEYNELLKLSVEDYLIRFKVFVDGIARHNEQVNKNGRSNIS